MSETTKELQAGAFTPPRIAAPHPIPPEMKDAGACVSFAVANLRNTPKYYAMQRNAQLSAVSLSAAAYYFDFWTEVCAIMTAKLEDFGLLFSHFSEIARGRGADSDNWVCVIVHSRIPSTRYPVNGENHCTAIILNPNQFWVIDAINGIARFSMQAGDAELEAAKRFLHWDNAVRFALEIDGRDIELTKIRRYSDAELSHILNAPNI